MTGRSDRSFTSQGTISKFAGGLQLSHGVVPAAGKVWDVQRVFWRVTIAGTVGDGVQTYLYRLPSSFSTERAMIHMGSSLDGWLGCCGNADLTGNGDMKFSADEVTVRPGQLLWIFFIIPAAHDGFRAAVGMSAWERAGQ